MSAFPTYCVFTTTVWNCFVDTASFWTYEGHPTIGTLSCSTTVPFDIPSLPFGSPLDVLLHEEDIGRIYPRGAETECAQLRGRSAISHGGAHGTIAAPDAVLTSPPSPQLAAWSGALRRLHAAPNRDTWMYQFYPCITTCRAFMFGTKMFDTPQTKKHCRQYTASRRGGQSR